MKKLCIFLTIFAFVLLCPKQNFVFAAETSAKACVVMEANSGRVLYSKNADMRLPEASTTKIMTALVVVENADLDAKIAVPAQAAGVEGSSIYLRAGEHLTIKELLYGLMLQSGNDCAVALAMHVGGTIRNFADMMNKKAQELGCKNTHFVNPHGLPNDDHYTTAHDLGLIGCAAMNNETVKEIVSSKKVKISNEGYDYDRVIINKNKILSRFDGANGVKTGYTKKAGRCFVGAAERNGMQLVAVLLNCGPMFEDSMDLMEECFDKYQMKDVCADKICGKLAVERGKSDFVALDRQKFFYPLKKDDSEDGKLSYSISLPEKLKAPVKKRQTVGNIAVSFDNRLIFSSKIVTLNEVQRESIFDRLFDSEKKDHDATQQIYGGMRC